MRNRIFGGIGFLWGGAILVGALLRAPPDGSAHGQGMMAGYVFGALLFAVGGYYLLKGNGRKRR